MAQSQQEKLLLYLSQGCSGHRRKTEVAPGPPAFTWNVPKSIGCTSHCIELIRRKLFRLIANLKRRDDSISTTRKQLKLNS